MNKILLVILLSFSSNSACVEIDRRGDPVMAPYGQDSQTADFSGAGKGMVVLAEVLRHIKKDYYKDVDLSVCIFQILSGGISECTDEYSYYVDPIETKQEKETLIEGKSVGIGVLLEIDKKEGVKIIDVLEGSPAEKAGLQKNDIIIAISSNAAAFPETWTALDKIPLDQVGNLMLAPRGTKMEFIINRNGEQKKLSTVSDVIDMQFINSKLVKEKIGYVKIKSFEGKISEQFFKAMQKLDSLEAQSIIIDLRDNVGGKVGSALDICSWFSKNDFSYVTILYEKNRNGPFRDLGVGNSAIGKFKNKHIVILQNKESASASEILSGYLKYEAGATVVGEKSFGKGILQTLFQLPNGGELHLTTAEYFIGSKQIKVHGIGISPDIEIKNPKIIKSEQDDIQLQYAIREAEKLLNTKQ